MSDTGVLAPEPWWRLNPEAAKPDPTDACHACGVARDFHPTSTGCLGTGIWYESRFNGTPDRVMVKHGKLVEKGGTWTPIPKWGGSL